MINSDETHFPAESLATVSNGCRCAATWASLPFAAASVSEGEEEEEEGILNWIDFFLFLFLFLKAN